MLFVFDGRDRMGRGVLPQPMQRDARCQIILFPPVCCGSSNEANRSTRCDTLFTAAEYPRFIVVVDAAGEQTEETTERN